jgi:hypothetical protein
MPERLTDQSEIYVTRHEMRRQAVFQNVRVTFLRRQPSSFGRRPKDAEELCAIEPAALLAGEEIIRAISKANAKPRSQCIHFVKEWLPTVLVKRLDLADRTFEPTHIERAALNVSIGELHIANFTRPQPVPIGPGEPSPNRGWNGSGQS